MRRPRFVDWLIKQQLFPDLRKYSQGCKHYIEIPGVGGGLISHVTIDSKYLLFKDEHSYDFFVLPALGSEPPSFSELVFYANCLAYDHDAPTLLSSRYGGAPIEPLKTLKRGSQKTTRSSYRDNQLQVLELLGSLKWGGLQYVEFRWNDFEHKVDLQYSIKYLPVAKQLSLYGLALRQFEPLSEFLHYYRIIESVDRGNGKEWIRANLDRIENFDFGFLDFQESIYEGNPNARRRVNLFQRYRLRAERRLNYLGRVASHQPIEDYFYHVNRCGIAHGKRNLRLYDFSTTVADLWKDVYVIKLLSRIAIQDKMGSGDLVQKYTPPGR